MCTAEDRSVGSSWSVFYSLSLTLNCKHPSQRDFSEKLVEVVMLRWSLSSVGEACLRRDEGVFFSLSGSSESRFQYTDG